MPEYRSFQSEEKAVEAAKLTGMIQGFKASGLSQRAMVAELNKI